MKKSCYEMQYDVIVAGDGVSRTVVAIVTGRVDAKVLIVEQSGYLGGALTRCSVGPMVTFRAREKQVVRGIMEEIVERLKNDGYSTDHIYGIMQYISYLTPLSTEGPKVVLDETTEEADCQVLFHTFIGGAECEGGRIIGLTVCNEDGVHKLEVAVHIDGTRNGGVASSAGVPMTKGRESDGTAQSMTMNMKYANVDTAVIKNHIRNYTEGFSHHQGNKELMDTVSRFSFCGFQEEFWTAETRGELEIKREGVPCFETGRSGEYIVNTIRVIEHDVVSAASLSDVEVMGRRQRRQLDRFPRSHVPGLEHALLESMGSSVGVRGSRQLSGKYTLTAEDILKHREFDNVIAYSVYPTDIHNPKGLRMDSRLLLEKGTYYSILYETLYCEDIIDLLVAGRCISVSFETQAAIRMIPTAGTLGHVAGAAATLAAQVARSAAGAEARRYGEVAKVDVEELQRHLVAQDVFLDLKE